MQGVAESDRVRRETEYHNGRFTEETRAGQEKYYWAILDCNNQLLKIVKEKAANARVLEYGCSMGEWSLQLSRLADSVVGIDISDIAVAKANKAALDHDIGNCQFFVMDAHATTFADNSFDLVFGSGIIHHLDTKKSFEEIRRILKPGGVAVFKEPLGANFAINAYRRLTPSARTFDEHPLLPVDEALARSIFGQVEWSFYGLATLGAVPFRRTGFARAIYRFAARLDRAIARVPGLRWQMWYALISLRK